MRDETFRIVIAGGGSGGHVYPTLAVLEALEGRLKAMNAPMRIIRMGPRDGYDALFTNLGADIRDIAAGKIRRYASWANLLDVPKFFVGFIEALAKLYAIMPDIVFSKGGTGALPVVVAAWFYRIPVVIHESDAHPGLTNLFSARFARKVFVSFAEAATYFAAGKTEITGTPLRTELFAAKTTKELAKETLGFDPQAPLTIVLGGSLGSRRINEFVLENLGALIRETQILHQAGVMNIADVQKLSRAALIDESTTRRYQAIGYLDQNLGLILTAADLAVMRAGSATIAEVSAFGVPAILIPLEESANGHQRVNAYAFVKTGGGVVIEEGNLLPGIFLGQVKAILGDPALRAKMSEASAKFSIPGAADKIADEIIQLVAGTS